MTTTRYLFWGAGMIQVVLLSMLGLVLNSCVALKSDMKASEAFVVLKIGELEAEVKKMHTIMYEAQKMSAKALANTCVPVKRTKGH